MHAGATLCLFIRPSCDAIAIAITLYVVTAGLGWSVGIHRGLIHNAFSTYRFVENILAVLGTLSGLGGPLSSSRTHFLRDFCQSSPGFATATSPLSFWQNYLTLPFFWETTLQPAPPDRVSECLEKRSLFRWLENRWLVNGVMAAVLYLYGGFMYLAWGLCARIVVTANLFAIFDFYCHSYKHGSQRFEIKGGSCAGRNVWLVALLTFGEGWHNNHHAMPRSPRMGIGKYEVDIGYLIIQIMHRCGLAWDLIKPSEALKPAARQIRP